MKKQLLRLFLRFSNRSYSVPYRILSMLPGTLVFLVISPLFLFLIARRIRRYIPLDPVTPPALVILAGILLPALLLMISSLHALWVHGRGTPAPIAPTEHLVTRGPYRLCRNPIELGTNLYFLALGTWFDSLNTGLLCMLMGLLLGTAYIRLIEEHELRARFGHAYETYLRTTPFMLPRLRRPAKPRGDG